MSDIALDVQSVPTTPAAGTAIIYVDSVSKKLSTKNDAGVVDTMDDITNFSVAAQTPAVTDTYLIGSNIALLSTLPRVGTLYTCTFDVAKTAAGTTTPILIVRVGTLGTTGDAVRLTFTFPLATAIADVGTFSVWALFRTIGASGVLQGRANLVHKGTATGLTGLSVEPGPTVQVTSAAFDTTVASSIIGISVTPGTASAWTIQMVNTQMFNL